jgi:hypothetical protein
MLAFCALVSPSTFGLLEITITISAPVPLLGSNVASMRDCNITTYVMKRLLYKARSMQHPLHVFKISKHAEI